MVQGLVEQFTYLGIFAVLFIAGLGVPIPEEAPILAAAILASEEIVRWWVALPVCIVGVLSGDVVLYWTGRHWGERILNWRLTRFVLTREREERLKIAYHRHAAKTIFSARHVMGLRAAAFLTAGIAHVPFWKFFVVDALAASFGVPIGFGLAYFFTDQLEDVLADVHRVQRWLGLLAIVGIATVIGVAVWRRSRRAAEEP
jgi:membrane protein DedA with SNARE-associated domain